MEKPFASVLIRIIEMIGTAAKGFSFAEEDFFTEEDFSFAKTAEIALPEKAGGYYSISDLTLSIR